MRAVPARGTLGKNQKKDIKGSVTVAGNTSAPVTTVAANPGAPATLPATPTKTTA